MVIDASAAVDLLLGIEPHAGSIARLVADEGPLAAPHLLDAEVGDAPADGVANLGGGEKVHQQLFHATHEPGTLENRLWESDEFSVENVEVAE